MVDNHPSKASVNFPNISVLLPIYKGDTPSELACAIESIANQSRLPEEVFIVKDGPLTDDLESVLRKKSNNFPTTIHTYQIRENQGLGNALRVGLKKCSYDVVARMDADDISIPSRFERQLIFLNKNSEVDIVGGYIEEFDSDPNDPIARREVPTRHDDIERMARFRNPMNHATVMFDKESVLKAGNYRGVDRMEDYDLWIRLLLNGATFGNIPEVLVKVRGGQKMYGRRGGLEYAREEIRTQIEFYRRGFTSFPIFIFNSLTRVSLRLIPNRMRGTLYQVVARD